MGTMKAGTRLFLLFAGVGLLLGVGGGAVDECHLPPGASLGATIAHAGGALAARRTGG